MVNLTVPAGTFQACKFEITTTLRAAGVKVGNFQTVWYGVGSGLSLKERGGESTVVLLEARIDGGPT